MNTKLKNNERGLVVSNPISIDLVTGTTKFNAHIDGQFVKSILLFWDRFDWPETNNITFGCPPDIQFLIQEKIFQRSHISNTGGDVVSIVINTHLSAYNELDVQSPGQWSMASGKNTFSLNESEKIDNRGILFQLHEIVPVPHLSVPYDDILLFKQRRSDELSALRHRLEDIYQSISNAPDKNLAEITEVEKLDHAISDHIKVMRESKMRSMLSSITANLDLGKTLGITVATSLAGLPISSALLVGTASGVSLNSSFGLRGKKKSYTPFEYITSISKEFQ